MTKTKKLGKFERIKLRQAIEQGLPLLAIVHRIASDRLSEYVRDRARELIDSSSPMPRYYTLSSRYINTIERTISLFSYHDCTSHIRQYSLVGLIFGEKEI